jgi:hypothetical protein
MLKCDIRYLLRMDTTSCSASKLAWDRSFSSFTRNRIKGATPAAGRRYQPCGIIENHGTENEEEQKRKAQMLLKALTEILPPHAVSSRYRIERSSLLSGFFRRLFFSALAIPANLS